MQRPVVVELIELGDDEDRRLMSAVLLDRIRAAARLNRGSARGLRHVTILEEAHHLLTANETAADRGDGGDLRTGTVRVFTQAIAEMRSYGEGFILVSQDPLSLAPSAINNTAVRILHHVENERGRGRILDDMNANSMDRDLAATLRKGEALVRLPEQDSAELVTVQPAVGVNTQKEITDEVVRSRMAAFTVEVRQLLPYQMCSADICIGGCNGLVRSRARALATTLGPEIEKEWRRQSASQSAVGPLMSAISPHAGSLQDTYCTAVHLQLDKRAFLVHGDARKTFIEAARASTDTS